MLKRLSNRMHCAWVSATLPAWKVPEYSEAVFAIANLAVIDNFLSQSQFAIVKEWAVRLACDRSREQRKWPASLVLDFAECYGSMQWASDDDSMAAAPAIFFKALRDTGIIPTNRVAHIGVQRWMPGSGCGMHNDYPYAAAATLYLNEDWNNQDGGYFLCKAEGGPDAETLAFAPKTNRLITTRRNLVHGVGRTSQTASERVTLQVFLPFRTRKRAAV